MVVNIKKAVIPVAGLGTRMLPATKAIPKELLTIYDRPIIEHVVQEAIAGGIKEIILVTRSGKEAIENHFDANYELEHRLDKKGKEKILGTIKNILPEEIKVTSIRQKDALGLGHAVLCAKHLLNNEPFAVLLPDVFVLDKVSHGKNYSFTQLVRAWDNTGVGQIMVEPVSLDSVENYGIADLGDKATEPFKSVKLKGLIEKPSSKDAPSNLAALGRYILPFSILDLLETNALTFDCGSKQGFLGANVAVGLRENPLVKAYLQRLLS